MARYIDAEKIKYHNVEIVADDYRDYNIPDIAYKQEIDCLPTADVQEVKHGKWIPSRDKDGIYEEVCSECGYIEKYNIDPNNNKHPNYCPHCGAKMDGE